ncbi:uncharacterized protein TNIN_344781 [Trichonephila inaurata madagascariensis]|uniref:Prefoldin subunit 5 n=1 Tax=Trichonephila inaurata madagascariensis TaxID=2747483 RepID=A0A8X6X0N3_9ARAC|nr:uncharacterized protein TNIN_344781 [Trichonephila inaurata madagascariensis]
MTAVNLDVAVPPFQANVEDTKTMSLLQIVRQKEEIEAEVESLCNLMFQLNKSRLQYESTVEIVNKPNSLKDALPTVIPLTSSVSFLIQMYVQGDVCKANKIILSVGSDYQMEVDKETAINHFLRKIQRIKTKINMTQNILAAKIVERERLRKATAEKYIEESKKSEMNLPPKFTTG